MCGFGYRCLRWGGFSLYVPCEVCVAQYNRETLEASYKGRSIADVLDEPTNGLHVADADRSS